MKSHYSIVAICAVLFFFSCSKDSYTPPFTSEELKLIPYPGNDNIVFTDSIGNTLTLVGSAREESFTDPARSITMTLTENSSALSRHHWMLLLKKSGHEDEFLAMRHCEIDSTDTICGEDFVLQVSDEELMFYSEPSEAASSGQRLSSITFGNGSYSNVSKINPTLNDVFYPEALRIETLYYNSEFGIICFELADGERWFLKR